MIDEFSEYYINIGLKVSYFRKKAGLTQEQLAAVMGVGTSFIGQIEAPNIVQLGYAFSHCKGTKCSSLQIPCD